MQDITYDTITNPTNETYKTLNKAYDFFNKELFNGTLPPCLITMQRRNKSRGYFCAERFMDRKEESLYVHEIALNPTFFNDRSDEEIISTLVHEMVHLWQQEHGDPPRKNYHNREWAEKMDEIGLIPSNTGEEGGARTGQSMTHYINPNGKYTNLVKAFFRDNPAINYQDRPVLKMTKSKSKNKVKYTCPNCGVNAWGKEGLSILCGNDKEKMIQV